MILKLKDCTKCVSRKICVAEKVLNFHTVKRYIVFSKNYEAPITGYLQDSKNSMLHIAVLYIEAQRVIDLYKVLVNGIKCGKPKTATTVLTLFVCLR